VIGTGLRLEVHPDAASAAEAGADLVADVLAAQRAPVLGVATGSSPLPLYRALSARVSRGRLDLSAASVVALDEYVGIPADHPQSYRTYVDRQITGPLRLDPRLVRLPDGTGDPEASAAAYERHLAELGRVDLQVLGLGHNGHLGFNEPGTAFDSTTHVVELSERTRRANARYFDDRLDAVPTRAVTQGLATIMRAGCLLVLVSGQSKAAALRAALQGPLTPDVPASLLREHPRVVVLADVGAAAELD
jgi:glucosamine-6-phosphate deaminase